MHHHLYSDDKFPRPFFLKLGAMELFPPRDRGTNTVPSFGIKHVTLKICVHDAGVGPHSNGNIWRSDVGTGRGQPTPVSQLPARANVRSH